jgi:Bacterial mobilisation protein (MobC)
MTEKSTDADKFRSKPCVVDHAGLQGGSATPVDPRPEDYEASNRPVIETSSVPKVKGDRKRRNPHVVSFRTRAYGLLLDRSEEEGLSPSQSAKKIVENHLTGWKRRKPVRPPKPKAEIEALRRYLGHLGKIGSNLNQLTRRANTEGSLPHIQALQDVTKELREAVRACQKAIVR